VTGEWRKLHNEELRDLYSSPSIIRIIKSRRVRWARHVERMRAKTNAYKLLTGKPEGMSMCLYFVNTSDLVQRCALIQRSNVLLFIS
jgi:hypothetical protein